MTDNTSTDQHLRSQGADRPLQILLICSGASVHIGTVIDHISAFVAHSAHVVTPIDATFCAEAGIALEHFDVVVMHYSVVLSDPNHIRPSLAAKLRAFDGLKVAFIQDEYRWIDRQNAAIEDLGVQVLYSVTNPEVTRAIYRTAYFDQIRIEHTLTGFVPRHLTALAVPEYEARSIDVSYRARRGFAWYGAFAEEKFLIGERFKEDAKAYGLRCDIESAEDKRIYGDDWIRFIASSKCTLGVESGVSFIDFSGDIQAAAEEFERNNPDAPSRVIRDRFLGDRDGQIAIKVISPRVFEAAALRTLLVLYPGSYSGVLQPGRHYVELARDHSNMASVASVIRDPARARAIIEAAYHEVAQNPRWWLESQITAFDAVVREEYSKTRRYACGAPVLETMLAGRLRGQWDRRVELDVAGAGLATYRQAHDTVAAQYQVLADQYAQLASHHQDLSGHYDFLVRSYQDLAMHHQMLVQHYQDLVSHNQRLGDDHQALVSRHASLAGEFAALQTLSGGGQGSVALLSAVKDVLRKPWR